MGGSEGSRWARRDLPTGAEIRTAFGFLWMPSLCRTVFGKQAVFVYCGSHVAHHSRIRGEASSPAAGAPGRDRGRGTPIARSGRRRRRCRCGPSPGRSAWVRRRSTRTSTASTTSSRCCCCRVTAGSPRPPRRPWRHFADGRAGRQGARRDPRPSPLGVGPPQRVQPGLHRPAPGLCRTARGPDGRRPDRSLPADPRNPLGDPDGRVATCPTRRWGSSSGPPSTEPSAWR